MSLPDARIRSAVRSKFNYDLSDANVIATRNSRQENELISLIRAMQETTMRVWLYTSDGKVEPMEVPRPTDPLTIGEREYKRWESRVVLDAGHDRHNFYLYAEGDDRPPISAFAAARVAEGRVRREQSSNG